MDIAISHCLMPFPSRSKSSCLLDDTSSVHSKIKPPKYRAAYLQEDPPSPILTDSDCPPTPPLDDRPFDQSLSFFIRSQAVQFRQISPHIFHSAKWAVILLAWREDPQQYSTKQHLRSKAPLMSTGSGSSPRRSLSKEESTLDWHG